MLIVYTRNSEQTLMRLLELAKARGKSIAIRLVKGAYWDSEPMLSAQIGLPSPLFSNKSSSDAQFEKLSRICIDNHRHIFPAFASHNLRSLSHAICYARAKGLSPQQYETQMLYGMADNISYAYAQEGVLTRLYVPLGNLVVGMGYFMRRLLENTSNESFLRHTFFEAAAMEELLAEPQFRD